MNDEEAATTTTCDICLLGVFDEEGVVHAPIPCCDRETSPTIATKQSHARLGKSPGFVSKDVMTIRTGALSKKMCREFRRKMRLRDGMCRIIKPWKNG
jgi:hypothetical protein